MFTLTCIRKIKQIVCQLENFIRAKGKKSELAGRIHSLRVISGLGKKVPSEQGGSVPLPGGTGQIAQFLLQREEVLGLFTPIPSWCTTVGGLFPSYTRPGSRWTSGV